MYFFKSYNNVYKYLRETKKKSECRNFFRLNYNGEFLTHLRTSFSYTSSSKHCGQKPAFPSGTWGTLREIKHEFTKTRERNTRTNKLNTSLLSRIITKTQCINKADTWASCRAFLKRSASSPEFLRLFSISLNFFRVSWVLERRYILIYFVEKRRRQESCLNRGILTRRITTVDLLVINSSD